MKTYQEHLVFWQKQIYQRDLDARNLRKGLISKLGVKISNNHDIQIVGSQIAGLTRCAIEMQNALKWYNTQIQAGDATAPLTAVEKNRHTKFIDKSEALWKLILSQANNFDKNLASIQENVNFLDWTYTNHPLTHRETER